MTMKPVTELYEEAEGWAQGVSDTHGEDGLLRAVGAIDRLAGSAGTPALLEVLDLVATLPPERLGLVRWAAGLDTADALAVLDALVDAHGRENSPAVARLRDGLMTALSGGEGDKKCGECAGTGKVKRLEGGGSIRVVKYDPCPKCAEGEGGAKEEATEARDPNGHRWARGAEGSELCADCGVDLQDDEALRECGAILDKRTVLRAGKPPPFLRVGMLLRDPVSCRDVRIDVLSEGVAYGHTASGQCSEWASRVRRWPLAEPFTVEGES